MKARALWEKALQRGLLVHRFRHCAWFVPHDLCPRHIWVGWVKEPFGFVIRLIAWVIVTVKGNQKSRA